MNDRIETTKNPARGFPRNSFALEQFAVASTLAAGRPAEERRERPRARLDCILYVSLRSGNGGIVLDISETGMALYAAGPLGANEPVYFRFLVASIGRLEISGELIWVDETRKRCGVRFIDLQEKALEEIRKWVSPRETTVPRAILAESRGRFAAAQALAAEGNSREAPAGERTPGGAEARENAAPDSSSGDPKALPTDSRQEDSLDMDPPGEGTFAVADEYEGETHGVASEMDLDPVVVGANRETASKEKDSDSSASDSTAAALHESSLDEVDTAYSTDPHEADAATPAGNIPEHKSDELPEQKRGPLEWTPTRERAVPDEEWREYANEVRRDGTRKLIAIGAMTLGTAILLLSFTHRVAVGHAIIALGAKISGATVTIKKDASEQSSDTSAMALERHSVGYQTGQHKAPGAVDISADLPDELATPAASASDAAAHEAKYANGVDLSDVAQQQPVSPGTLETAALRAGTPQGTIPGISGPGDKGQAELQLARQYLSESDVGATKSPAAELLWLAVEKGNTDAEIDLADLYGRGEGVQKNCQQARTLLAAVSQSHDPYVRGKAAGELNILGCK